jgi:1,2-dihydroxy-3-keto-5-methylthiopentene dioxygenase
MKAYWLTASECIDLSLANLATNGVIYAKHEVEDHREAIDAFKLEHGYVAEDVVELGPQTSDLEQIRAKFRREHLHSDDEVRYVLDGEGIFDIRSTDDCWMRVFVTPGDLIVVPKDRYHRFMLLPGMNIKALRLFRDQAGWVPNYRQ